MHDLAVSPPNCIRYPIEDNLEGPNTAHSRVGANPLDESQASLAPAPLQPLVRPQLVAKILFALGACTLPRGDEMRNPLPAWVHCEFEFAFESGTEASLKHNRVELRVADAQPMLAGPNVPKGKASMRVGEHRFASSSPG